jgi:acyl carrier protein
MYSETQALDPEEEITSFGMDSISALEIRNELQKKFGVSFSISAIFGKTIRSLTQFIQGLLESKEEVKRVEEKPVPAKGEGKEGRNEERGKEAWQGDGKEKEKKEKPKKTGALLLLISLLSPSSQSFSSLLPPSSLPLLSSHPYSNIVALSALLSKPQVRHHMSIEQQGIFFTSLFYPSSSLNNVALAWKLKGLPSLSLLLCPFYFLLSLLSSAARLLSPPSLVTYPPPPFPLLPSASSLPRLPSPLGYQPSSPFSCLRA